MTQVAEWREKYQTGKHCAIITFKHESFPLEFNEDQLKCDKRKGELVFQNRFDKSLVDLKFTGFEKPHVMVILLTDVTREKLSISEATSLLAATTRAQLSLSIVVMSNKLKEHLSGVANNAEDEHILLSSSDTDADNRAAKDVTLKNIADRFAIMVQQEDVKSIEQLLSEFHTTCQFELFKLAIRKTFQQVMGKKKDVKFSELFDEHIGWSVESYFSVDDVIDWLQTGYERGYINNITQFQKFLQRFFKLNPVPHETIQSSILDNQQNILYEACFCGSGDGIKHAMGTLTSLIGVSGSQMIALIVKRNYIIEGGERKESLLSMVTKTNKDFEAIGHLLDICLDQGQENDRWTEIEQSITEAFRWPIKFRSFKIIECMLKRNEQIMYELFRNALNEFGSAAEEVRQLTLDKGNKDSQRWANWLSEVLLKEIEEKKEYKKD